MALGITNLRKGTIFLYDRTPWKVVEYSQKVMGRGGSIVNVKIKNLLDGKVLEKTFKGNESLQPADITQIKAQYLYNDGTSYFFMNNETYEQYELSVEIIGDDADFLKEGAELSLLIFNGSAVSAELPKNVWLEVSYTENVVKGDTTSSVQKDAKLESGLVVKVPAFINVGDVISVDTSTGEYRERKK